MNDIHRPTTKMYVVDPGTRSTTETFVFEMQPRAVNGRTVSYELLAHDAELLHKHLGEFLTAASKATAVGTPQKA